MLTEQKRKQLVHTWDWQLGRKWPNLHQFRPVWNISHEAWRFLVVCLV